jgi:hypothetical protein
MHDGKVNSAKTQYPVRKTQLSKQMLSTTVSKNKFAVTWLYNDGSFAFI